jgi:hypothetical protein
MTDSELLTKVEAAIDALLTDNVQSYQIAGRQVVGLGLDQLYKMRTELTARIARVTNGGFVVARFRKPR